MALDVAKLSTLTAVAFDVDGVLTDGRLTWDDQGHESKSFGFADIMGMSLLRRAGLKLALISGEDSPMVDRFAAKMQIPFVRKGTRDKGEALCAFVGEFELEFPNTAFFGDDINDLFAMDLAGLCCCPANAAADVLEYVAGTSGFISTKPGGDGAVREFADMVLKAKGLAARDVFSLRSR